MKRLDLENKANIITQIRSYLESNSEAKFIHRLQVILQYAEGKEETCDRLGIQFGNSPRSVSNWIKKLNRTGVIESLRCNQQTGRPKRLTQAQKHELRMVLSETPEKHGETGKRWNGINLSRYIARCYGIALSVRACQLLLSEPDFRGRVSERLSHIKGGDIPPTKQHYPQ
jgi:transposase